jgi:hypothetical protein
LYGGDGLLLKDKRIISKDGKYEIVLSGLVNGIYYVSVLGKGKSTQLRRVIRQTGIKN